MLKYLPHTHQQTDKGNSMTVRQANASISIVEEGTLSNLSVSHEAPVQLSANTKVPRTRVHSKRCRTALIFVVLYWPVTVDWNKYTKACYFGQHHGAPHVLAAAYASAHALGCVGDRKSVV